MNLRVIKKLSISFVFGALLTACGSRRRGEALARFTAQRQMFMYLGLPRSTCSMVGVVTYALGGDIAKWLQKPIDGAALGEL